MNFAFHWVPDAARMRSRELERRQLMLLEQNVKLLYLLLQNLKRETWEEKIPHYTASAKDQGLREKYFHLRQKYIADLHVFLLSQPTISPGVSSLIHDLFTKTSQGIVRSDIDLETMNKGLEKIIALLHKEASSH